MKSKKFPKVIYITKDNDGDEEYFLAWDKIPEQPGDLIGEYSLDAVGRIIQEDPTIDFQ